MRYLAFSLHGEEGPAGDVGEDEAVEEPGEGDVHSQHDGAAGVGPMAPLPLGSAEILRRTAMWCWVCCSRGARFGASWERVFFSWEIRKGNC
jgi:hypothetical protein